MRSIMDWAEGRSIPVVEDCAQSVGAMHDGQRAGSFGHVATTSFYPTKNLGALGDGGAVLTSDADVAVRLRRLRQYGWEGKYRATMAHGRNSRMDELQAAVIRLKLPFVDAWNDRRRRIHKVYEEAAADRVRVVNSSGPGFVGHLAVVDVSDRASVAARFADARVRTDVHYPIPDHRQPLVANASHPKLPVTERAADRVLSLPLFPWLTDDEVDRVAAVLRRVPA
jgi:dTDP-4-amino-4,6-dideoxygalactose transaminase